MPGDDAGHEIRVQAGGESALSGSDFSYTLTLAGTTISDTFPQVRSASAQWAAKCVPYIELDFEADGFTVKGVRWRFVNPDNPAAPLSV